MTNKEFIKIIKKQVLSNKIKTPKQLAYIYLHRNEMFDDPKLNKLFTIACKEFAIDMNMDIEFKVEIALSKLERDINL